MSDDPWAAATFDGNRRLQHEEFMALSFREKLEVIERMAEVSDRLAAASAAQSLRSATIGSTREARRAGK